VIASLDWPALWLSVKLSAVVTAILYLILADAVLTTVFHYVWP